MPPKQYQARPLVLRELTLLRALGASLRTSSYRAVNLRHVAMPLSHPPTRPDAFAVLPRKGMPTAKLMPDKR